MSMDGRLNELDGSVELRREIAGQPAAVAATLEDAALDAYIGRLAEAVAASDELLITGMGASLHAGAVAAALLRGRGLRAWTLPASELVHYGSALAVRPLLVLSQSGASVEVERLLDRVGGGVFGLTLDPGSPLGRFGAGVIPGGPERAYAATRSFTSTLTALLGLSRRLGVSVGLEGLASSAAAALEAVIGLDAAVDVLMGAGTLVVTGRGPLAGLAEYVALLVTELARVPCVALETAQFRHGPLEAAGPGLGVLALRARGATEVLVGAFVVEVASTGSPTVLLDAGGGPVADGLQLTVSLPAADEVAALLPLAVVAQRLAAGLAEARGIAPGVPLRSAKVTREE